jgi:hypothetical protein
VRHFAPSVNAIQMNDELGALIAGDNGTTYLPTTPLDAVFQHVGLAVAFAGVPVGTVTGATLIELKAISAH